MDGGKINMDIKKMLIVSFVVAVLLLVPFNVASGPIALDSRVVPKDDSKLVEESEPGFELPDNMDLERIDISKNDLADFEQRERDVEKLIVAVEDYIGQDLPLVNVPVFVEGVKVGSVSIIDMDESETMSVGGILICLPYLAATILWLLFAPFVPLGYAAWAFEGFLACLGASLIGDVGIADVLASGETVELSQFVTTLEQPQTVVDSCPCQQEALSLR